MLDVIIDALKIFSLDPSPLLYPNLKNAIPHHTKSPSTKSSIIDSPKRFKFHDEKHKQRAQLQRKSRKRPFGPRRPVRVHVQEFLFVDDDEEYNNDTHSYTYRDNTIKGSASSVSFSDSDSGLSHNHSISSSSFMYSHNSKIPLNIIQGPFSSIEARQSAYSIK